MKDSRSLSKNLTYGGLVILIFIIMIALAGGICIRILKKTSHEVVIEFAEMEALQNVLMTVSQIAPITDKYLITNDPALEMKFQEKTEIARNMVNSCIRTLTERHDRSYLDSLLKILTRVDSLQVIFFRLNPEDHQPKMRALSGEMEKILDGHLKRLEGLLTETKQEVEGYISINKTATVHSAATVISLGIILLLTALIGGYFFIRKITAPSKKLLDTMRLVTQGDFKAKATIDSKDEFGAIAEGFNLMMDRLNQITISKNRYTNILDSMVEGVLVTDKNEVITAVSKQACTMIGAEENSLTGIPVEEVLSRIELAGDPLLYFLATTPEKVNEINLKDCNGNLIPVSVAISPLRDQAQESAGYVVVIQDLREKKKIEKQLEQIRKEKDIAIHEAQENERLRLATDLHDGLVQILTGVGYAIENLEHSLPGEEETQRYACKKVLLQVQDAITESRRISRDLIPLALHDHGLVPAIQQMAGQLNLQQSIHFEFTAFNMEQRSDPRIEKALYRICQESVSNILKHSKAKNGFIQLIRHSGSITLLVEDDGIGFQPETSASKNGGVGLESIRKRAETFGGTLILRSSEGQGTEVIVEIPCL